MMPKAQNIFKMDAKREPTIGTGNHWGKGTQGVHQGGVQKLGVPYGSTSRATSGRSADMYLIYLSMYLYLLTLSTETETLTRSTARTGSADLKFAQVLDVNGLHDVLLILSPLRCLVISALFDILVVSLRRRLVGKGSRQVGPIYIYHFSSICFYMTSCYSYTSLADKVVEDRARGDEDEEAADFAADPPLPIRVVTAAAS